MSDPLTCPTCADELAADGDDVVRCGRDHRFTALGLALATNIAAVRALWMAIHALEDDAGSLRYIASRVGDKSSAVADERRKEAEAALQAADTLRNYAKAAQDRLDALPVAPSLLRDVDHPNRT